MITPPRRAASALSLSSVLTLASIATLGISACDRGAGSSATTAASTSASAPASASASVAAAPSASSSALTGQAAVAAARSRAVAACSAPDAVDRRGPCKAACELGDAEACEKTADLLRTMSVDPNGIPSGWYGYLAQACDLGRASACTKRETEFAALRAACTKDAPKACVAFDQAVEQGKLDEPAHAAVDEALRIGCDANDADGCVHRGMHLVGWEPQATHRPQAAKAYERACELGQATYCCAASRMYVTDTSIPRDVAKATALYKKGLAANATGCVDPATLPPPPSASALAAAASAKAAPAPSAKR